MAKLDLKEASFSVPVAEGSRRISLEESTLPIHLPTIWTKQCPMRPYKAPPSSLITLWDKGIRCLLYLDDMLILGESPEELEHNFKQTKSLLTTLGFLVNEEKSISGPTQEMNF